MRGSSGTPITMPVEAHSATLCGINCAIAVFGLAMPLFLWWRGGAPAPQGARPLPCDSIRRLVQYIWGGHILPLSHVDN